MMKRKEKNELGIGLLPILLILLGLAFVGYIFLTDEPAIEEEKTATESDINKIIVAQITQYPTALRGGIERLLIRDVSPEEVVFIPDQSQLDFLSKGNVFNPKGAVGLVPQDPPGSAMVNADNSEWIYNKKVILPGVGYEQYPEMVAILEGLTKEACQALNDVIVTPSFGVPVLSVPVDDWTKKVVLTTEDSIAEQLFVCIENKPGQYVYLHTLYEG